MSDKRNTSLSFWGEIEGRALIVRSLANYLRRNKGTWGQTYFDPDRKTPVSDNTHASAISGKQPITLYHKKGTFIISR